jgi:kynurenine formamidase
MNAINYSQIIDLTHVIHPNIPIWPGDPNIEFKTVADIDKDGYYLRRFSLGEHSGTHINAPNSFYPDKEGIDEYKSSSLVVAANVINIKKKTAINSDYVLTIDDVKEWEKQYNLIAPETVVLLYAGWQEKWSDRLSFLNPDEAGKLHFPGFAGETTKFLLEERGIVGVGIDTHGVDGGLDESFATNKLILSQSGIVLENLNNLHLLPPTGATLVIGIIRLKSGSGSPVSVMAFC